jgi:drug/metabolite transporter (DMT)-like permease
VVAIIVTCFLSMALFDARPTALFWGGVAVVSVSIWLYSQKPSAPKPVTTAWSSLNLAAPPEPA